MRMIHFTMAESFIYSFNPTVNNESFWPHKLATEGPWSAMLEYMHYALGLQVSDDRAYALLNYIDLSSLSEFLQLLMAVMHLWHCM